MPRALLLLAAVVLAASLAPAAQAAGSAVTAVELGAAARPGPARRQVERPFTLAGIHWQGPGRVLFRTRSLSGRWSAWHEAAPEDEDGPDLASREGRASAGWRIGNPWWVGPSGAIETRTVGRVSRVRAFLVWSPELGVPYRAVAVTSASTAADPPLIVPRVSWGADESIRRGPPSYAPEVRFAVVHHTAGRNAYTRSEAPAIVKAIQLYHVQGNGWNDIGYNFLVDRFGTVYEGRFGGVDRNVVGAHALGFNTGSVGIALLGTYGDTAPSRAAQDAIARLLAWRLDLAHVDPTGTLAAISGGNERYASGIPVLLRVVSGHRDTGSTECPGDALYARLDALAAAAGGIGLPKIYEPRVEADEGLYRFQARLSSRLPWAVVLRDPAGNEVGRGSGTGSSVDWTWDASGVPPATYAWSIGAASARPATGTLRAGAAGTLAIESLSLEPAGITPNGDGQGDSTVLTYRLSAAANVTVEITDAAGTVVALPVDRVWTRAGESSVTIDGTALADGRYGVVVTARTAAGVEAQAVAELTVSRTLAHVAVTPNVFSPNGDGRRDRLTVSFTLAASAGVRVLVVREGRWVATPFVGSLAPGPQRVVWNGERSSGRSRDGSYEAVVEVSDEIGTTSFAVPFVSDTLSPQVRIVPGRRLRVEVSEPVVLVVRVDGATVRRRVARAGLVRIPGVVVPNRVRVLAWDEAGNRSEPAVWVRPKGGRRAGQ